MGHTEDPKDGGAVAAAVFGAVAVYGVRIAYRDPANHARCCWDVTDHLVGISHLLRITGLVTHARKPERRDLTFLIEHDIRSPLHLEGLDMVYNCQEISTVLRGGSALLLVGGYSSLI